MISSIDFQFVALSVPCSKLDPHTMEIFRLLFWAMSFSYHIVFLSLTLDYGCHSCKVYVGLAKEKSLNCICYFLVLLLKIQTSNLEAWDIIWFLKLETCKKIGFFHELSKEYVILENQMWTGLKTGVKVKNCLDNKIGINRWVYQWEPSQNQSIFCLKTNPKEPDVSLLDPRNQPLLWNGKF